MSKITIATTTLLIAGVALSGLCICAITAQEKVKSHQRGVGSPQSTEQYQLSKAAVLANRAKRAYGNALERYKTGNSDPEGVYLWSRRWLEAQRKASTEKVDQTKAFEDHCARMKELEELVKNRSEAGTETAAYRAAAEFYRAEAELWLARDAAKPNQEEFGEEGATSTQD